MLNGYMGKLLYVDLSHGTITEKNICPDMAKEYIGGAGLATKLYYDEFSSGVGDINPLGPENLLMFMSGPLTGTAFPSSARYEVCTKSPLTGLWVDANSSGSWGASFKRTGYDGIVIRGRADKPVYLWINNNNVEIKDATGLWGQDALNVQESIQKELNDKKIRVTCIGPSGEKQVLLSALVNDEGRAIGRGGIGAVMGAKNLKAIAVKGTKKVPLFDEEGFKNTVKEIVGGISGSGVLSNYAKYGTACMLDTNWSSGEIPVKNWQMGLWKEGCIKLGGKKISDTVLMPHPACLGCPVRCVRWIEIEEGSLKMEGAGPDYETLSALGTLLLNDNLEAVCWANDLCNRYGLDAVSTGSVIAFAMEAYEKGLISKADLGGFELTWGNYEAINKVIELIGNKKGFGEILGKGVKQAAENIGKGSEKFAVHVKGLEVPMHDPRAYFSLACNYATSPIGACYLHGMSMFFEQGNVMPEAGITYNQGRFDKSGKGFAAKIAQDFAALIDSLVACHFSAFALQPTHIAVALTQVTGLGYTAKEVMEVGERVLNLQRLFNLNCGLTRKDDKLPPRLLEPLNEGGAAGKVPDLEYQLKEYYHFREWDTEGVPSKEKLTELGITIKN